MAVVAVVAVVAGLGTGSAVAGPAETWPERPDPTAGVADTSWAPVELQSAVAFQRTFLKIIGGKPEDEWRGELEGFAAVTGSNPVLQGLRQLARVWLARVEMEGIDAALVVYYRQNVRFPDTLDAANLPGNLKRDPWGDAWIYQVHAPEGFARLGTQRYRLEPGHYPGLAGLKEAIGRREPPARGWKIAEVQIAGGMALEFRMPGGAVATVEPGGRADDSTLMYIGQKWALMAGIDQLFTTAF